jgi:hypothetical protein
MTIPEKRAALIAAGIKVGEKATGFVVETLFEKNKDKIQGQDLTSSDVSEVVVNPEPEPVIENHNPPPAVYTPPACIAKACEIGMRMGGEWHGFPATTSTDVPFAVILARHHDNVLAERNPPVVAWAMRNLCEEDFITRYGNRKFDF